MKKYRTTDATILYLKNVSKYYNEKRKREEGRRTTDAQLNPKKPPPLRNVIPNARKRFDHPLKFPDKFVSFNAKIDPDVPTQIMYRRIIVETPLAFLFVFDDTFEKWLPKSLIFVNFRRQLIETDYNIASRWKILAYKNDIFIDHGAYE